MAINIILIIVSLLISISCNSQDKALKKEKRVGTAKRTANPNTPRIFENGFLNYTIINIPVIQENDTINLNELKFNATYSATYTQKVMFDKFGKWTKEIRPNNEKYPILVWDKIKLFEDDNQLFTVFANGDENWNEIYSSVLVFNSDQKDCLSEESIYRQKIITFFSHGIQKLKSDDYFYNLYYDSINKFESKK